MKRDSTLHRDFTFTAEDFDFVAKLVKGRMGIVLLPEKEDMVYGRVVRRLRSLNIKTFKEYKDLLDSKDGEDEFFHFLNALTTNLTRFFREDHHFRHLEEVTLPEKIQKAGASEKRLRIWSAGSSSGQEPYSIGMVLHKVLKGHAGWDAKILATDIDTNMLDHSRAGIYNADALASIPDAYRKAYITGVSSPPDSGKITAAVRESIIFKRLNLMGAWPMKGPFDAIFCRNVAIYFDRPTQKILFERMYDLLADDGYLYIGHSENLFSVTDKFHALGKTIYVKA